MAAPAATPRSLRPEDGLVLFGVCFLLFQFGGSILRSVPIPGALLGLGQWIFIALPVLLFVRWRGADMRAALLLAPPRTGLLLWSAVLAVGVIALTIVYMAFQDGLLEQLTWYRERRALWQERLTATSGMHMAWLVFTVAVTPAICEEMLFRGAITTAFAHELSSAKTCVLVGLLFGLFHGDPLQILPTAVLGMVITWLALRTGSLVPCVLFHLIFNSATLAMHRWLPEGEVGFGFQVGLLQALALGGAAVTMAALWGLWPRPVKSFNQSSAGDAPAGAQNATGVNPS